MHIYISFYLVILYELICKGLRYKYISQIAYQNALLVFWKSPRMHQIVGTLFCRTLHEGLRTWIPTKVYMENPLHPVSCKYRPLGNICVLHFQVVIRVHKETRAFVRINLSFNLLPARRIHIPKHTHATKHLFNVSDSFWYMRIEIVETLVSERVLTFVKCFL